MGGNSLVHFFCCSLQQDSKDERSAQYSSYYNHSQLPGRRHYTFLQSTSTLEIKLKFIWILRLVYETRQVVLQNCILHMQVKIVVKCHWWSVVFFNSTCFAALSDASVAICGLFLISSHHRRCRCTTCSPRCLLAADPMVATGSTCGSLKYDER